MSTGKIITGVLVGVAAGTLLGVLFAPAKGSETRHTIAQKTSDTTNDIKNEFRRLMDEVADKFGVHRDQVTQGYNRLKNEAKDLKNDAKAEFKS